MAKKNEIVITCTSPLKGELCRVTGKTDDGRFTAEVLTGPYKGESTNVSEKDCRRARHLVSDEDEEE